MEDAALGGGAGAEGPDTPPGAFLELLNPPEEDVPMEELLAKDEKELPTPSFPRLQPAWRRPAWILGKTPSGRGAGS